MARMKKFLTPEEELERINSRIAENEEALKTLKAQRKVIEEKIKQDRLDELDRLITESGKSFDEIKELLNK